MKQQKKVENKITAVSVIVIINKAEQSADNHTLTES